jgi:hypothetical protein
MTRDSKGSDEFVATVYLNPTEKHYFKFVVDDVWRCSGEFPTENDPSGNVNNWRIPTNEKHQDSYGELSLSEAPTISALNSALAPASGGKILNGANGVANKPALIQPSTLLNGASLQQQQQQQQQQQSQQRGIKVSQR